MRILLNGATTEIGAVMAPALLGASHAMVGSLEETDVMVDFTNAKDAVYNVMRAVLAGVPAVVGVSDFDVAEVEEFAVDNNQPVFYAPDFSIGSALLRRFAREAAGHFAAAEVIEFGAALTAGTPSERARAAAEAAGEEVPVHTLRLPGIFARQEVLFGGTGETLTLRHEITSANAYAAGVELAVKRVRGLEPGVTVGLERLLWDE